MLLIWYVILLASVKSTKDFEETQNLVREVKRKGKSHETSSESVLLVININSRYKLGGWNLGVTKLIVEHF